MIHSNPSLSIKCTNILSVCQGRPSLWAPSQCRLMEFWWINLGVIDQNGPSVALVQAKEIQIVYRLFLVLCYLLQKACAL